MQSIAYDTWQIEDLEIILTREGQELPLEPFAQNYKSMGLAVDLLESLVLDGKLRHGGHPVLNWCCSNTVIEYDSAGNRKLSKRKSTGRIDGMVALTMAISQSQKEPLETGSIYETRGLLTL